MFFVGTYAADVPMTFSNHQAEQRFSDLIKGLRCLVCQNQSFADFNANLPLDLPEEIHNEMLGEKSNNEIIDYLVARYGDFVLYRPPLKPVTYLLEIGQALLGKTETDDSVFIFAKAAQGPPMPLALGKQI